VFERAGLAMAAAVMNAVILTSILSAGNSGMYASVRMLYAMGKSGMAYKSFRKVNRFGVPVRSVLATLKELDAVVKRQGFAELDLAG